MANFICFEAAASDESDDEVEQLEIDNLIDDSETQENNDASFFRFHNQTTDTDEVLREAAEIEAAADQLINTRKLIIIMNMEEKLCL